jgi:transketolase
MQAAELLAAQGVKARVVEIHTIKPLDVDLLVESAKLTGALVTVEEHAKIGGLGSAVAEALAEIHPVPMQRVGLADQFCVTGRTVEGLLDYSGLAVADIVSAAQQVLKRK